MRSFSLLFILGLFGACSPYDPDLGAYELDIDDAELKRAPSFMADKDFDWGDRSREEDLHRYYGIPPYWGGY